jgi:hypothetical protein
MCPVDLPTTSEVIAASQVVRQAAGPGPVRQAASAGEAADIAYLRKRLG